MAEKTTKANAGYTSSDISIISALLTGETLEQKLDSNTKARYKRTFTVVDGELHYKAPYLNNQVANAANIAKHKGSKVFNMDNFEAIMKVHHDENNHPGREVTVNNLRKAFHNVPDKRVRAYVGSCATCMQRNLLLKPPPAKTLVSSGPMVRFGIDLIDLRSYPSVDEAAGKTYKWILHGKCHSSKFTVAAALEKKAMDEVVKALKNIFFTYGPCRILQYDNGKEFDNTEMKTMLENYFPMTKVRKSRPRHPQVPCFLT